MSNLAWIGLGTALVAAATVVWRRRRRAPSPPRAVDARWLSGSFSNGEGARSYKLYVPRTRHEQPLPLVVMLHGCLQDPDDFAAGTGMNEHAERAPFLVLYPEQDPNANSHRCWNWFEPKHQARDHGEPALLVGMMRQVMQDHGVDRERVYVAGLSAGGAMAVILAVTHPELFAAVGVHSGMAYRSGHGALSGWLAMQAGGRDPRPAAEAAFAGSGPGARAVPLILFHGDRDHTTKIRNAAQIRTQWLRLHHLADGAEGVAAKRIGGRAASGETYTRSIHSGARGEVVLEEWIVHGLGHAWSGGDPSGSFTHPRGPSASAEMARFFAEHPLRPR